MIRKISVFAVVTLMAVLVAATAYGMTVERFIDNMYDIADVAFEETGLPLLNFEESAETEGMLRFTVHQDHCSIIIDTFDFTGMVDVAYLVAGWEQPGELSAETEAFFGAFLMAPLYEIPGENELKSRIDEVEDDFTSSRKITDGMLLAETWIDDYVMYFYMNEDGMVLMHIFQFDLFSQESGIPYVKELLRDQRIRAAFGCDIYSYEWYYTILNMTTTEVSEALGLDYINSGSGGEGSLPGYYYRDLGITLGTYSGSYDDDFETIDFIQCWDDAWIGAVEKGMTLHEIEVLLGPPDKAYDGDDNFPYDWYYYISPLKIDFSAYDSLDHPTYCVYVSLMD